MNKAKTFILIIFILLLASTLISTIYFWKNKTESIYCVMEDSLNQNKMEIYFDFKNGQVYRYSIINTNKLTENINIDAYKDMIALANNKYKGATEKFWADNDIYMTTEIYNLDLLTEEEFKEITGMSLQELKSKNRKEIINSIIPMSNKNDSLKCN